jgi:hypothetical protein
MGDSGMRPSSLTYILVGVVVFAATYRILNQPLFPNLPSDQIDVSGQYPFEQKSDSLPIYKDEAALQHGDLVPANVNRDELATARHLQDRNQPSTNQSSDLKNAKLEDRNQFPTNQSSDLKDVKLEDRNQFPANQSSDLKDARVEDHNQSPTDQSSDLKDGKQNLSYLAYYAYSEVPPETKPADTVLKSLEDIPHGSPVEEIKRVSDAFGLDFNFMKAVAKVESDFNPKERTGSYIGLFQLSNAEFQQFGSGDILDPRDNAVAAAYKFLTEDILFEISTHKKPTLSDIYLVHQQGVQGAAEHVSHPDRIAWKSMCVTDEGRQKGEKWCKRAIWGNTLPEIKHVWKSVEKFTSGAFVKMWQERVHRFYGRYSEANTN